MVILLKSTPMQAANMVLAQTPADGFSGELGLPILPIIIGGGAFLLGGGTLWHLHERHTEKTDYQKCLEKYTSEPHNMAPEEAALVCKGDVKPKGFKFGLNAPTFVLVAGSVFGLWFMTQLMISAARK